MEEDLSNNEIKEVGSALVSGSQIRDEGPIYHEYNPNGYIKEPWNAFSSLIFLVPVFFWAWRLKGVYRKNKIIVVLLPFLFLNGIGSTLFHAFRSSNYFLYLDSLPALMVCIIISYYLWNKILHQPIKSGLILVFFGISLVFLYQLDLTKQARTNTWYFIVGTAFLLPLTIILVKTRFYKWHLIFLTCLFLMVALFFRILDSSDIILLPMGVHWLWHVVSAFAVFSLGYYLYYLKFRGVAFKKFKTGIVNVEK